MPEPKVHHEDVQLTAAIESIRYAQIKIGDAQKELHDIIHGVGGASGLKGDVAAIRLLLELQLVPNVEARLQKLEDAEASRVKLAWAMFSTVLATIGLSLWNWIKLH